MNLTQQKIIEDWSRYVLRTYSNLVKSTVGLPIPIADIAEKVFHLRCDLVNGTLVNKNVIGVLLPDKRRIIVINEGSINRARYTIAHELGHWVIDYIDNKNNKELGLLSHIIATNTDYKTQEQYANKVAASLLMPVDLLEQALQRQKKYGFNLSALAQTFGVSPKAMQIRLHSVQSSLNPMLFNTSDITNHTYLGSSINHSYNRTFMRKSKFDTQSHMWLPSEIQDLKKYKSVVIFVPHFEEIDFRAYQQLKDIISYIPAVTIATSLENLEKIEIIANYCEISNVIYWEGELGTNIIQGCIKKILPQPTLYLNWYYDQWQQHLPQNLLKRQQVWFKTPRGRPDEVETEAPNIPSDLDKLLPCNVPLYERRQAKEFIKEQKEQGRRVVLATGCFDILTIAHVRFLKNAKAAGDILVVGIEDSNRVKGFKGEVRPVNTIGERIEVIQGLKFVDYVFVIKGAFKVDCEPFYTNLYKYLKPNILAVSELDGAMAVRQREIEAAGGKLVIVQPYEQGTSSTTILQKLLAQHPELPQVWYIAQPLLKGTAQPYKIVNLSDVEVRQEEFPILLEERED